MKNKDITPFDSRLKPHEGRLVAERIFLANKLEALQKFIVGSPEFPKLPHDERTLMLNQRDIMDHYLKILNQRVDRIVIPTPGEQGQATGVNPLFENAPKAMTEGPCNCFACQLSRQMQAEAEQRAKATPETPPEDVCDCPQCQLERKVEKGKALFAKVPLFAFEFSRPPLPDNIVNGLQKMLTDQINKRFFGVNPPMPSTDTPDLRKSPGVDQGQAPQTEPVGMDPQADSFEAIQEPPMRRFQVQTVTTKTELTTIGAFDEQDAIARVGNGQGDTGTNQLIVTSTAQLLA